MCVGQNEYVVVRTLECVKGTAGKLTLREGGGLESDFRLSLSLCRQAGGGG